MRAYLAVPCWLHVDGDTIDVRKAVDRPFSVAEAREFAALLANALREATGRRFRVTHAAVARAKRRHRRALARAARAA